jgi:transposase
MTKKYIVTLTDEERQTLRTMISTGKVSTGKAPTGKAPADKAPTGTSSVGRKVSAKMLMRARILLQADVGEDWPRRGDEEIAAAVMVSRPTVERVRKQFVEEGFEAALTRRKSRRVYARKLDGDGEAHLVALSCQKPPEGYARWSLRLLADKLVELEIVDSISHVAVRDVLKKTSSSPG